MPAPRAGTSTSRSSQGAKDVDGGSPLCQAYKEAGGNIEIRIPDKIAAVKELTRMCGWAKPDRVELAATDTLAEFIQSIRQGGQPARPDMAHANGGNRG